MYINNKVAKGEIHTMVKQCFTTISREGLTINLLTKTFLNRKRVVLLSTALGTFTSTCESLLLCLFGVVISLATNAINSKEFTSIICTTILSPTTFLGIFFLHKPIQSSTRLISLCGLLESIVNVHFIGKRTQQGKMRCILQRKSILENFLLFGTKEKSKRTYQAKRDVT